MGELDIVVKNDGKNEEDGNIWAKSSQGKYTGAAQFSRLR